MREAIPRESLKQRLAQSDESKRNKFMTRSNESTSAAYRNRWNLFGSRWRLGGAVMLVTAAASLAAAPAAQAQRCLILRDATQNRISKEKRQQDSGRR